VAHKKYNEKQYKLENRCKL